MCDPWYALAKLMRTSAYVSSESDDELEFSLDDN